MPTRRRTPPTGRTSSSDGGPPMVNPAPEHVELDTAGGTVYALLERWKWPGADQHSTTLVLQPANGSGEPGGQPCTPTRHRLNSAEVKAPAARLTEPASWIP